MHKLRITACLHTFLFEGTCTPTPGTGIWGYKLKFKGTTFGSKQLLSYFNGISSHSQKFIVIPVLLEIFDPQSFPLPDFDMHLLKSATLFSS